jgi:hypothetical protein
MNPKSEIDPGLMKKLSLVLSVPARDPGKAKDGRASFLMEAQEFAGAVTPQGKRRRNGWMHAIQSIFVIHQKERSPMFSTLATIFLIVSLVLGGGGATIAAAQNSQPDQPLYGIKVMSENVRQNLAADPQTNFQLALNFANRRAEEIALMLEAGQVPPEAVQARYQNQIEQAIQYAVELPADRSGQALEQIRTRLQTHLQTFNRVSGNGTASIEAALLRSREMLQDRLHWVEQGLENPVKLRDQQQLQNGQNSASPGTGAGNPWTTGTPTPGSGYGPGPGDCENCTPATDGQGANPWTTGTPTPGSGYGPGPGSDPTRTSAPGSESNPGPQPTQFQNNQPTQAGPQPTQQQNNQPTQVPPGNGPGEQPTNAPGGPGGNH